VLNRFEVVNLASKYSRAVLEPRGTLQIQETTDYLAEVGTTIDQVPPRVRVDVEEIHDADLGDVIGTFHDIMDTPIRSWDKRLTKARQQFEAKDRIATLAHTPRYSPEVEKVLDGGHFYINDRNEIVPSNARIVFQTARCGRGETGVSTEERHPYSGRVGGEGSLELYDQINGDNDV
jgi:hypothetical protein